MKSIREFLRMFSERAFFLLSVPTCVFCKEPLAFGDKALCSDCMTSYRNFKGRNCSVCSRRLQYCTCVNDLEHRHHIRRSVKIFRYLPGASDLPSNALIYSLKRDNRRDVVAFLAAELAGSIRANVPDFSEFTLAFVPRRRASIEKYGFDHAKELTKALSACLGIPYADLLRSKTAKAQKRMTPEERLENAVFVPKGKNLSCPEKILLVDDIVTSGASMVSVSDVLREMGVETVIPASVAIAYRDQDIVSPTKRMRILSIDGAPPLFRPSAD